MKFFKILLLTISLMSFLSCESAKHPKLDNGLYAKIETVKGNILIKLEYQKVPFTVANFVSLAEGSNLNMDATLKGKRFYDGLKFHRVVPDFVIQGGDPQGTGEGGPGYRFEDEFPKDSLGNLLLKHDTAGILSMANSGKNTNGSQFFITHRATPHLDGRHSVFGKVMEGQEVVNTIAQGDIIEKIEIIRVGKEAKNFDAAKVFDNHLKDFNERMKKQAEEQQKILEMLSETQKETANYFAETKAKAKSFPSGLKMYFTQNGKGAKPAANSEVQINYAGYFENGQLFDSNLVEVAKKNGQYDENREQMGGYTPMKLIFNNQARLIPGFKEGMLNMKLGDKALLFIPSHLGYGEQGAGNVIPPNTNLVFEIELVE